MRWFVGLAAQIFDVADSVRTCGAGISDDRALLRQANPPLQGFGFRQHRFNIPTPENPSMTRASRRLGAGSLRCQGASESHDRASTWWKL